MAINKSLDEFLAKYKGLADRAKREQRMALNHVCIRVRNIDAAEKLLSATLGIESFVRLPVSPISVFPGEKALSAAWLTDDVFVELMEPTETPNIGYDAGVGLPIGHMNELGFFVSDLNRELERLEALGWSVTARCCSDDGTMRMAKVDTNPPSGIPIELIESADGSEGTHD